MKIIKGIAIIVTIIIFMCSCENSNEKESINILAPIDMDENEEEFKRFLDSYDTDALFRFSFDDSYSKCKIIVEIYEDGDLVETSDEVIIDAKNSLDIALGVDDIGNLEIKARSNNSISSGKVNTTTVIDHEDKKIDVWKFLNYQVDLKYSEPQIIGINYIDDSGSISHKTSTFKENIIENVYLYRYLRVIKVLFE